MRGTSLDAVGGAPRGLPVGFESAPIGVMLADGDRRIVAANPAFCRLLGRTQDALVGCRPFDFTHPDDVAATQIFAAGVLRDGTAQPLRKRFTRPDGSLVLVEVSSVRIDDDDGEPMFYSQVVDIGERERALDALARSAAEQAAVAALGRRALDDHDVMGVLQFAVDEVRRLMGAHSCFVVTEAGEASLRISAVSGSLSAPVAGSVLDRHPAGSLSAFTMAGRDPVVCDDADRDLRFRPSPQMLGDGSRSGAAVPIRGGSGNLGVICVSSRATGAFRTADLGLLQSVATVLASALERASADAVSRYRALHDPLTGLPNRNLLLDRLAHALAGRERRPGDVAALMLDVDGFKFVNDSLGHGAGDRLLVDIARRLADAVRPGDTVGRLGGDEFMVICEDVEDGAAAVGVAERLRASLRAPFDLAGREVLVSASVGVAVGGEEPAASAQDVLRDADAALYRAKAEGRDGVQLFDHQMREHALSRLTLECDLRRALAGGQLHVAYQPIVRLGDGGIVGVEALARWRHPEHGMVPPDRFIALAEESDLIVELGEWVLRRATADVAAWQREIPGAAKLGLTVNVSPRQVIRADFADRAAAILAESGLADGTLGLEVTENVLIQRIGDSVAALDRLRARGVEILVDDFGTGYSSLSYLRSLPIATVKLDRSFVWELGEDERGAAIPAAVMGIGTALGLHVIAEGVETEAQRQQLLRLGCAYAQGYLFAAPMAPGDLGEHLRARLLQPAVSAADTGSVRQRRHPEG